MHSNLPIKPFTTTWDCPGWYCGLEYISGVEEIEEVEAFPKDVAVDGVRKEGMAENVELTVGWAGKKDVSGSEELAVGWVGEDDVTIDWEGEAGRDDVEVGWVGRSGVAVGWVGRSGVAVGWAERDDVAVGWAGKYDAITGQEDMLVDGDSVETTFDVFLAIIAVNVVFAYKCHTCCLTGRKKTNSLLCFCIYNFIYKITIKYSN